MSVRPRPPWMHMLAGAAAIGGPCGVILHSRPQAHARIYGAQCQCAWYTCGNWPWPWLLTCVPVERTPPANAPAPRRRASSQRPYAAQHSRQQGAPRANSLFWPVYLSNGPSKRVSYTPNAMAIPSREDFSRAPLGTEVGKPTSGHGQAAYNQNKKHRYWRPYQWGVRETCE